MNFALLTILDTICTKSKEEYDTGAKSEKVEIDEMDTNDHGSSEQQRTDLLGDQMSTLSELMLQHILLDQFYADYSWPSSAFGDTDEHNDSELEAIKIFIER